MQILAKYGSTSSGERTSVFGGLLRDEVRALILSFSSEIFSTLLLGLDFKHCCMM